jgi:prevent-host-death family protein
MKKVNMHTARANLTDLVSEVHYGGERVVIARRDKPLAVLVSVEDAEALERIENGIDVREARKAMRKGQKPIPWEKAKKELGIK